MTYNEWERLMAKIRQWCCIKCGETKTQLDTPSMLGCTANEKGVHVWVKKGTEEDD